MTLEEKVHGLRLHVIRRAEQLGNISRACREAARSYRMGGSPLVAREPSKPGGVTT